MKFLIFTISLVFFSISEAQVLRFTDSQVQFYLQENEGSRVSCTHSLLPQVPWWKVQCGNRNYTVNTWAQLSHNKPLDLTKVMLMFDVSEGVQSSGEKMVQFHSHISSIYVESLTNAKALSSELDVLNGQASLCMDVLLF